MTVHLPLLTTSAAALYRACPRAYYWAHEQLIRPAYESEARTFGTLGHHGLEAWWQARGAWPSEPERWLAAASAELDTIEDPFAREAHRALLAGYHARWSDAPLTPIAVEREYVAPLRNPETGAASRTWAQAGKIDVLVVDEAGDVWVMDHKFTSSDFSAGSDYRTSLLIGAQVSNYLAGARHLGHEPRGWIHDVIRRPKQRPLRALAPEDVKWTKEKRNKAGELVEASRPYAGQQLVDETPEGYGARIADAMCADPDKWLARFPVVRLDDEVREAAFDMWQVGVQIRESRTARAWPRNGAACVRYSAPCDFLPICSGQSSPDDATRYRRAERAHEELSGEVQQQSGEGEAA